MTLRYGFRRNPLTKSIKTLDPLWGPTWSDCETTLCHCTSREEALSFEALQRGCLAYVNQEQEPEPTAGAMALDLVRLIEVGLVLVEPLGE